MISPVLCLSVRFLDPVPSFHGRGEGGRPEWPPSPLRLFQALVAAAGRQEPDGTWAGPARAALKWLETVTPIIIAPPVAAQRTPYRLYVPHNAGDLMTAAWAGGDGEASMARHRTDKDLRPTRMAVKDGDVGTLHYLYPVSELDVELDTLQTVLCTAARSVTHLGWGIDLVAATASILDSGAERALAGDRWLPGPAGPVRLRCPRAGTLDGLIRKHIAFLNRLGPAGFTPVPPLTEFDMVAYRPASVPVARPFAIFELLNDDDSSFGYPQQKLVHLAGMMRHLAITLMTASPPQDVPDDWPERYVAGHARAGDPDHRQFSYVPLPSIGHPQQDLAVRRVMIVAPMGDEPFLSHLARLLAGRELQPTHQTHLGGRVTLIRIEDRRVLLDTVCNRYLEPAAAWASVTPVILPGHDDHKPHKTRRLIEKALSQSGIDQSCAFQWSTVSGIAGSLTAHQHDRANRPTGYIRPDHLLNRTAVHLQLIFEQSRAGPLTIGSGRHCGLGLFARSDRPDS